jgi:hypothetical protein
LIPPIESSIFILYPKPTFFYKYYVQRAALSRTMTFLLTGQAYGYLLASLLKLVTRNVPPLAENTFGARYRTPLGPGLEKSLFSFLTPGSMLFPAKRNSSVMLPLYSFHLFAFGKLKRLPPNFIKMHQIYFGGGVARAGVPILAAEPCIKNRLGRKAKRKSYNVKGISRPPLRLSPNSPQLLRRIIKTRTGLGLQGLKGFLKLF